MRYYHNPQVGRTEHANDYGRVQFATGGMAVVLGSDLIVATVAENPHAPMTQVLGAFDGGGNFLGTLAIEGDGFTLHDLLPHAIATARSLFSAHLLTPLTVIGEDA